MLARTQQADVYMVGLDSNISADDDSTDLGDRDDASEVLGEVRGEAARSHLPGGWQGSEKAGSSRLVPRNRLGRLESP